MKEEWRSIDGFEGRYQISNLGRVLSLPKIITTNVFNKAKVETSTKERIIKGRKDKDGYIIADLSDSSGKLHKCRVHRLVANAFIEKVDGKEMVNHKNGQKDDNRASNLEWCTNKENLTHAHHELYNDCHHYYNERTVALYSEDMNLVKEFKSCASAARHLGVSAQAVASCLSGKSKTCKGKILRYIA